MTEIMFRPVIDPGHGPGDGCSGHGIEEADYVYDVAHLLYSRAMLVWQWGVMLSRNLDEDPAQQERDSRAREFSADFIMSLHCDSTHNADHHGATVFYTSTNARSKQVAHEIARAMPAELWGNRQRGRVVAVPDVDYPDATAVCMRYSFPNVLVEFGFLSSARDAEYLGSKYAKERLVSACMAGLIKAAENYGA